MCDKVLCDKGLGDKDGCVTKLCKMVDKVTLPKWCVDNVMRDMR